MASELDGVADRLDAMAEELADLALERLRAAIDAGETKSLDERRITRARRAVEKAAALLRGDERD